MGRRRREVGRGRGGTHDSGGGPLRFDSRGRGGRGGGECLEEVAKREKKRLLRSWEKIYRTDGICEDVRYKGEKV